MSAYQQVLTQARQAHDQHDNGRRFRESHGGGPTPPLAKPFQWYARSATDRSLRCSLYAPAGPTYAQGFRSDVLADAACEPLRWPIRRMR